MTTLSPDTIFATLDATWPAARHISRGGWTLREGKGGGQRVSAATAADTGAIPDIDEAERGMRDLGQRPLFMIRPSEDTLDEALSERSYEIVDPVVIYAIQCSEIAQQFRPTEAIPAWPPLAIQTEIWAEAGIGPARVAIMERATCPRTSILARIGDRPAATIYVGAEQGVAMLHALETRLALRRNGAGRRLVQATAQWALDLGADWLTLAVVRDNAPANALYRKLGMAPATTYHYRRAREGAS